MGVLNIAVEVLTSTFLMRLTPARTPPRRAHPHRPARDVATPAVADVASHGPGPVPAAAAATPSPRERVPARR